MSKGSPTAGERSSKQNRPSIREIGPAWITAIAALIVALTGAGFFVGQKSAQTSSSPSGQNTTLGSGQQSRKAPVTPSSETATSTATPGALLAQTSVTLSSNYGITFGPGPLSPQQAQGDLGFNFNDLDELDFDNGKFSVFQGSTPTYHACATDQLYISDGETGNYSTGSIYCFVGHGVVAAATIVGYDTNNSDPINYVKVGVVVWKGS